MILEWHEDFESGNLVYTLRLKPCDLLNANLRPFDWALIRECEISDKVSDKLLALETLARRVEESSAAPQLSQTKETT